MRPRDAIEFVNETLKLAEGAEKITVTHMHKVEHTYSCSRRDALLDEWRSVYPALDVCLGFSLWAICCIHSRAGCG